MILRKIVFSVITFFLFFSTNAQNIALDAITIDDLKKHLAVIASDSLMGRSIGADNNGLDMAANYIKNTIKDIGLSPVNDSYFQPVTIYSTKPDTKNTFLQVHDEKGKAILKSESIVCLSGYSEIHVKDAGVVFIGFGDEKRVVKNKANFAGKIVMMLIGDKSSYKKRKSIWDDREESSKINAAIENGALGVILVTPPFDGGDSVFENVKGRRSQQRFTLRNLAKLNRGNNSILITASLADVILGGEGQLKAQLSNRKNIFQPDAKISIQAKTEIKEISTKNVLGLIEGSDPKLKDECVILMAHYDHLGVDTSGDYYNGADDNGSGVVTLLEVAEAMIKTPQKPKRSILFLWVTGEEIGLFGSQYYTSNPVFPLEKTVTCINIDMDGRVYEPRDSVWKDSPKKVKDFDGLYTLTNDKWQGLKEINSEKCKELGLIPDYSLPERFLSSSDHYHFHDNGVPILNLATGYHYDYHKPTDEISRISFEKIKRVADLCYLVSYEVANRSVIEF